MAGYSAIWVRNNQPQTFAIKDILSLFLEIHRCYIDHDFFGKTIINVEFLFSNIVFTFPL